MNALTLDATLKTASVTAIPIPAPAPSDLLVRVHAVALNPVDALYTAHPLGSTGRVVGSDFAGTIEALGSDVPEGKKLRVGARVAGFLQGACSVNERPGAFAEFLVVPWDLVWHVPDGMTLESAATVSLCSLTAAQGIFYRLEMEAPFQWTTKLSKDQTDDVGGANVEERADTLNVFIYGASTSLGLYAAQLVKSSGVTSGKKIRLIGAASTARHATLKAAPYAYSDLVDYRNDDWASQVERICGGQGLDFAIDCISEGSSVIRINELLGPHGKQAVFRSRAGGAWTSKAPLAKEPIYGAVWEGLGVEVQYQGFTVAQSPEARAFATKFYEYLSESTHASSNAFEPNPVRLMPGGLEKIPEDGFVLLGPGSMQQRSNPRTEKWMTPVSAEKLVYRLI